MEVEYCEYLAFGQPKQLKMPYENAKKRFDDVVKTLELDKDSVMAKMSFVGIKSEDGWIITN